MGSDEGGLRPLHEFQRTSTEPTRARSLARTAVALILVLAAVTGAYFFRDTLLTRLTAGQRGTDAAWVLPVGTPSMGEAEACLRLGDLPCAEADILAYLKQYPNDAHANALLAITLTQDGRHKEALYYYRKAEELGVVTYDFYAGYARTLDALGDIDGAISKNQAALRLVPRLVDVRGALADELVRKGRGKAALDLLTDFDNQLVSEGHEPYFTEQIRRIKLRLGGQYARDVAIQDAPPKPASPQQLVVEGEPDHGSLAVLVSIDGAEAQLFTVDSGASVIFMPNSDAVRLRKLGLLGQDEFEGTRPIQLANGTVVTATIYNLRSVRVSDRELHDVEAAVYSGDGPRLLGQSFLRRFKSWSIDNRRRTLTLNE